MGNGPRRARVGIKFKGAKRGARLDPQSTKIAVTSRLDADVLSWLREQADKKGIPYQTLMNSILKPDFRQ